jgi:hypothetical protein
MFDRFRSAIRNRQRQKWEKKRRHGRRFFLLYYGILRWGGIMFILTTITNHFALHQKLGWLSELSLLVGCLLAGYIWGFFTWGINERRFGFRARQ